MSIRLGDRQLRVAVARNAVIPRIALDAPQISSDLFHLDDMCTWQGRTAYGRGEFTVRWSGLGAGAWFCGGSPWRQDASQYGQGNGAMYPALRYKRPWLIMGWTGHRLRALIFLNEFFRGLTIAPDPLLQDLRFHPGTIGELPFEPSQAFIGNAFASGNAGGGFHGARLTRLVHRCTSAPALAKTIDNPPPPGFST